MFKKEGYTIGTQTADAMNRAQCKYFENYGDSFGNTMESAGYLNQRLTPHYFLLCFYSHELNKSVDHS